ncbi:hypothetical protein Lal_00049807 [Lupinus albus]|nr:hypothetical protein Lal_00049807 [Lupinus albus]
MTSLRIIGHAKAYNDLYILNRHEEQAKNSIHLVNTMSNYDSCFDLWHYRMGHPSHTVLKHLIKQFSFVKSNCNKVCDYCHLAKQTKYLWRGKHTFAIAQHKHHRSVYEEADANKRRKRYARPLLIST